MPRIAATKEKAMRAALLLLFLGLAPSTPGAAAPEARKEPLLAVMDILNNSGEFSSFVEGMPDMLITELMETGEVKLVERTKVQTAMKALKLENSGLTQESNLELGKWLGVDGILFGTFNKVGDRYRLDVRAIEVQTGKINVAASATCEKKNILDIIPQIGAQLRSKLSGSIPKPPPAPPVVQAPPVESGSLEITYKMNIALLSEVSIPFQRVRIYLDDRPLQVSGVVNAVDRTFILFKGGIPAGMHRLTLVHGTVDKQGRWVRQLENQPKSVSFNLRKDARQSVYYKMRAHDKWNSFSDFEMNLTHLNDGE